jgi:hypothetical protein
MSQSHDDLKMQGNLCLPCNMVHIYQNTRRHVPHYNLHSNRRRNHDVWRFGLTNLFSCLWNVTSGVQNNVLNKKCSICLHSIWYAEYTLWSMKFAQITFKYSDLTSQKTYCASNTKTTQLKLFAYLFLVQRTHFLHKLYITLQHVSTL